MSCNYYTAKDSNVLNVHQVELPKSAQLLPYLGLDACPWLDEYIEFSKMCSPRSFDGYHESVGIWILSMITARRVAIIFGGERYTNLYFLLVGRTTLYAKSTVSRIAKELINEIGLDFLLLPDECTPQWMIMDMAGKLPEDYEDLSIQQKELIKMKLAFAGQRGWYYGEFGTNLQNMMRKEGPYGEFRGLLKNLYDGESRYVKATMRGGQETIDNPYLALLGALTPADLVPYAAKGSLLWGDGYLARMAVIVPPGDLVTDGKFPLGERKFPWSLTEPMRRWHERLGIPKVDIQFGKLIGISRPITKLEPTGETLAAYYAYDSALREMLTRISSQDLDGNYGRLPEKALRIAALFASLANCSEIQINHWARAQEVTERFRGYLHDLYNQITPEIQKHREMSKNDKVIRAILNKQTPTLREIEQYTGLHGSDIEPLLLEFEALGKVKKEQVGRTFRYRHITRGN